MRRRSRRKAPNTVAISGKPAGSGTVAVLADTVKGAVVDKSVIVKMP